ncbi:MAG: tyrosinase family protein [Thermoanaerobaculia bacterium]|nr:tyrosinase family protein [Thermoanaerobaculia bacterium]
MGTRRNILLHNAARDAFVDGVLALKAEATGLSTGDISQILHEPGMPSQPLSTWDLFVLWHAMAMNERQAGGRNAAHSGPAFLPWHRWYLLLLEFQFQRVLGDPSFGLPYWDWATDGQLPPSLQSSTPLWTAAWIGGNGTGAGRFVITGPFRQSNGFTVRIEGDSLGGIWAAQRPLRRDLAQGVGTLPDKADVAAAMAQGAYDASPFNQGSETGVRNRLEGWRPSFSAPNTHNRVHVWVGGDMGPATSPNDPAFFLNHCNVDRLWASWQNANGVDNYQPTTGPATQLLHHRRNDPIFSVLTQFAPTNAQMLDVSPFYDYDTLTP